MKKPKKQDVEAIFGSLKDEETELLFRRKKAFTEMEDEDN